MTAALPAGVRSEILEALAEIVGAGEVTAEECDLVCYERDFSAATATTQHTPDFAVHPRTAAHVSGIAELASRFRIPLVPRGGGTGMWGGAVPQRSGIVLDMRKMDRIVQVDEEGRTVTAQAGATVKALANHLAGGGFFDHGASPWTSNQVASA